VLFYFKKETCNIDFKIFQRSDIERQEVCTECVKVLTLILGSSKRCKVFFSSDLKLIFLLTTLLGQNDARWRISTVVFSSSRSRTSFPRSPPSSACHELSSNWRSIKCNYNDRLFKLLNIKIIFPGCRAYFIPGPLVAGYCSV